MIGERDILGTQLIRRNDELALLYEKIKIQQSTLNKGQLQYRDRCGPCMYPLLSLTPIAASAWKQIVANVPICQGLFHNQHASQQLALL